MKTPCEVIRDLLPLYHDNVCSMESRALVEAHIGECADCERLLNELKSELECPSATEEAGNEAKPLKAIRRAWKKDKAKAFITGTVISLLIFAGFIGARSYGIPVPTGQMEISEASVFPDGAIGVCLTVKDDRALSHIAYDLIGETLYLTPKRAIISPKAEPFSRDVWVHPNDLNGATACYVGTPNDRVLIWQEGMELPPASGRLLQGYLNSIENVFVTNESATEITMIDLNYENGAQGAGYADNSPLRIGETFGFHLKAGNSVHFTVSAVDKAGNTIARADFRKTVTYNAGGEIRLFIRDSEDGNVIIEQDEPV